MIDVSNLLSEPRRNWERKAGATSEEIDYLIEAIKIELPKELLELLRFSNGGFGDLASPPRLLSLYTCDEIIADYIDEWLREDFSGFLFIGSNAGLESIAIDYREEQPYPIVMIDRIGGSKSAKIIASDCETFIDTIGLPYNKVE
jgi:hypothetical protein